MTEEKLKQRCKKMALRAIQVVSSLPKNNVGDSIGKQLVLSATSVAANYRSACKARSKADFLSKLGIVEEEADETQLWLELIIESRMIKSTRIEGLLNEVRQLTAIMAASRITARKNL